MTKITVEAVQFALAGVRQLKRRHQIPAVARILGVHESTVRARLKKKKPKTQWKRHAPKNKEITFNEIEIAVDVPAVYGPIDPDDMVLAALREHMGDEWPEEFA